MESLPLAGRTVAVPETRELEVFAGLLERRGARVLRCPLVSIRDAPDPAPVLIFARDFAGGAFDDLILTTGEGLRRLLTCIERHEPALRPGFLLALGQVRKITRGPKPVRALRELGLTADLSAGEPTTPGLIATLAGENLHGRRIALQLYGLEPNTPLCEFLTGAGATVRTVAPYVYAAAADDAAVQALLRELSQGDGGCDRLHQHPAGRAAVCGRGRRVGARRAGPHAGGSRGTGGRRRTGAPRGAGAPDARGVLLPQAPDERAGSGAGRAALSIGAVAIWDTLQASRRRTRAHGTE